MKTRIAASALVLTFGALVWSAAALAQGTIYKWVDSAGRLHIFQHTDRRGPRR